VDALLTAVNSVIPAFFLIAMGALADRFLPDLDMTTLARLSVYFFLPALVFNAITNTELTFSDMSLLSLAYLAYLLVLGGLAAVGSLGLSVTQARGVMTTTLFGNTGNMGLPITLFAYGEAGLERAVVIMVVSLVAMFAFGPALLAGNAGNVLRRLLDTLKLPTLWAALAGLMMLLMAWQLPESVGRGVTLLGNAAIPVMLLSLGMQTRRSWVWEVGEAAFRTTVLRMLVGPLIAYGAGFFLGLRGLDLNVLVLAAAMPAAVTMFVVAVEVKGDYVGVARSVVATTIVSLVVITGVIFLLPA
jgi:predicted permease